MMLNVEHEIGWNWSHVVDQELLNFRGCTIFLRAEVAHVSILELNLLVLRIILVKRPGHVYFVRNKVIFRPTALRTKEPSQLRRSRKLKTRSSDNRSPSQSQRRSDNRPPSPQVARKSRNLSRRNRHKSDRNRREPMQLIDREVAGAMMRKLRTHLKMMIIMSMRRDWKRLKMQTAMLKGAESEHSL
jgi:hypothetical protein